MRRFSLFLFCFFVTALSIIAVPESRAQQPTYLKLQPHKVQWAQQVMKEATQKKDSLLLAEAYYLFGKAYEAAGDFKTATDFFLKSLKIQEKKGDSYELVRLYMHLFNMSITVLYYPDAKRYSDLAMNTARRVNTNKALLRAYGTVLGLYYADWTTGQKNSNFPKPNYDSVLSILKRTEKLAHKSEDEMELVGINFSLGHEFLRRKDTICIAYFKEALTISRRNQKPGAVFQSLTALAAAYLKLGSPKKGYPYLVEANRVRKTLPSQGDAFTDKIIVGSLYVDYYKSQRNWKKAFSYLEGTHEFEKNKYLADREGALSKLNFEHELEKKELLLKTQQKELATNTQNLLLQRRFIVIILVLFLISVGFGIAFYRLSRKNQRISQRNAQLVNEQNHRVKNNLQVVSSLLSLHSNRLTDEQARQAVGESQLRVETMAILHRKLYDGDKLIVVNMRDFIQEVVNGVLLTYGFTNVETTFDIDNLELKPNYALPLGLIINELSTNACKYAFAENDKRLISLSCKADHNKINLTFSDNGPGFNFEQFKYTKSFGLKLIQIQVAQLYGTCEFRNENGTVFQMQFNLLNKPML